MTKIIVATGNKDKAREIKSIFNKCGVDDVEILTMKEEGINPDIIEDGETFEANALIKAHAVAALCDCIVLADDSGLEVDALGGEPGIYSARYMGEDTSYRIKNQAIIDRLEGIPDERRSARFVCAVAVVCPDGFETTVRGVMEGRIGYEEDGENGFGYDPIFYLPEYGCSSAAISPDEKNKISHRGKAFREVYEIIKDKII